jgi:hypothetical protein
MMGDDFTVGGQPSERQDAKSLTCVGLDPVLRGEKPS